MKAILKIWGGQKVGLRGNTQNLGWSKIGKSALIGNFYWQIFAKPQNNAIKSSRASPKNLETLKKTTNELLINQNRIL